MTADKRTVHTDALETLGTIITEDEKRDAIHLAVIPVQAKSHLKPGWHVDKNGLPLGDSVGIVDPFLGRDVMPGDWFWLVIYPRKINSLRHVWTHPAFPDEGVQSISVSKENAEARLREICSSWDGPDYDTFLEVATTGSAGDSDYGGYRIDGDYLFSHGRDASGSIPPEVWDLVETITGKKVESRPDYFSCSC